MSSHLDLIIDLQRDLSQGVTPDTIRSYFHPYAVQIEHPSLMRPKGHQRPLEEIVDGAELGSRMIQRQTFQIDNIVEQGDQVALQLTWSATTAMDLPGLPSGSELVAHVAMFYEFRDGRIMRLTSYDCYEPTGTE